MRRRRWMEKSRGLSLLHTEQEEDKSEEGLEKAIFPLCYFLARL